MPIPYKAEFAPAEFLFIDLPNGDRLQIPRWCAERSDRETEQEYVDRHYACAMDVGLGKIRA